MPGPLPLSEVGCFSVDMGQQRHMRPHVSQVTDDTLLWCPRCQVEHPAGDFNRDRRRYSGRATICRAAQADLRKSPEGRAATKRLNQRRWLSAAYRAKSSEWQRARRQRVGGEDLRKARTRLQRIVVAWKTRNGCVDCGVTDPRVLDPDHQDSTTKNNNVSRMVQLCVSEGRLKEELGKCVPRCARCHRRKTQVERPSKWRDGRRLPPSWQRRLDRQDWVGQLKTRVGCADCGWALWARGLDLDHVWGPKVQSVATLIAQGVAWQAILDEMAKCDVVCANCHRIRTWKRSNGRTVPTSVVQNRLWTEIVLWGGAAAVTCA